MADIVAPEFIPGFADCTPPIPSASILEKAMNYTGGSCGKSHLESRIYQILRISRILFEGSSVKIGDKEF